MWGSDDGVEIQPTVITGVTEDKGPPMSNATLLGNWLPPVLVPAKPTATTWLLRIGLAYTLYKFLFGKRHA